MRHARALAKADATVGPATVMAYVVVVLAVRVAAAPLVLKGMAGRAHKVSRAQKVFITPVSYLPN